MFIVLPPSETKSVGGDGPPLDFARLSFPELNPPRESIAADLQALPVDDALEVLGISKNKRTEAEANQALLRTATTPAIFRYTGVLYDALAPQTLPEHALGSLSIGSALFGLVRATDPIPQYRLSGSTKLPPRTGEPPVTMKKRWGTSIREVLASLQESGELIIDLRSGAYRNLGKIAAAITVRVEKEQADGSRKVVSHYNKHYKGLLARALALAAVDKRNPAPQSVDDVADLARKAGFEVELAGGSSTTELTLVV